MSYEEKVEALVGVLSILIVIAFIFGVYVGMTESTSIVHIRPADGVGLT